MTRFIVTTTINPPTKALKLYAEKSDWKLIVVGDQKTPHAEYAALNCIYLHPEEQNSKYPDLSASIGWNKIQRRNIGFVEAYRLGAEIVATVDDDNIPYDHWGENLLLEREIEVAAYSSQAGVFDPLSVTNHSTLWHRGYPLQHLENRCEIEQHGKQKRRFLVQADLWDGDPDVDAIARIAYSPEVKFDSVEPFCSTQVSPFNSQNTFISRKALPYYMVLPFVGRMDDIWGSYILQSVFSGCVVYNAASVYQDRNPQNLVKNLDDELLGYHKTIDLLENWQAVLPPEAMKSYEIYRSCFEPDENC
ncbi:MAG: hypothetical protein CMH60_05235 [Myxococcales bacterium]|nr:hypothetical protein [Myxococcales bacterium]